MRRFKILLVILTFFIFTAQTDVPVALDDLLIICPKCGRVFYRCLESEIFYREPIESVRSKCRPVSADVPEISVQVTHRFACPLDGGKPFEIFEDDYWPTGYASDVFTNKGWMPKRYRPK